MNEPTCSQCLNYHDRKLRGGAGERPAPYAWCKAKSVYLADDPDLPEGAQTTSEGVAKPVIVYPKQIVRGCPVRRLP